MMCLHTHSTEPGGGGVAILLKQPDQAVLEANLNSITISPHTPKLEPMASYATGAHGEPNHDVGMIA